jgi:hypothetical protein
LSPDQLAALAGLLEVDRPAAIETLKLNLEWIGARYLVWFRQDEEGPSRAEQNAALKKLSASPDELEPILAKLDYATQARLVHVLWTHPLTKYRGDVTRLDQIARDAPELVLNCAKLALAAGKKRGGSSPRKTLPLIIRWLASIYEETTGREFTHNPYNKTEYMGTPQSDAGRFVTAFLGMVDPDLPPRAIATEMARLVAARERTVKHPPSAVQTI